MRHSPLLHCSRKRLCPACGHDGWCSIRADGTACICMRCESPYPTKNGGWLHVLTDSRERTPPGPPAIHLAALPPDLRPLVESACAKTPPRWLEGLIAELGLPPDSSVDALHELQVHRYRESVSGWPMRDNEGRITGIRYRDRGGAKWSRKGGRESLFMPGSLPAGEVLVLPEGGTDTAALLALGFVVAGRPSCNGGVEHMRALVRRLRPPACVVVADADPPGQRGAHELATLLALLVADVRIVTPPAKDLRAWVAAGARRQDVEELAAGATRLEVTA